MNNDKIDALFVKLDDVASSDPNSMFFEIRRDYMRAIVAEWAREEMPDRRHVNDRWNLETTVDGFKICRGDHENSAACEWEEFVPKQEPHPSRLEFYAVVTERSSPLGSGPVVHAALPKEYAEAVGLAKKLANDPEERYGWARVARVTVLEEK